MCQDISPEGDREGRQESVNSVVSCFCPDSRVWFESPVAWHGDKGVTSDRAVEHKSAQNDWVLGNSIVGMVFCFGNTMPCSAEIQQFKFSREFDVYNILIQFPGENSTHAASNIVRISRWLTLCSNSICTNNFIGNRFFFLQLLNTNRFQLLSSCECLCGIRTPMSLYFMWQDRAGNRFTMQ